MTKILAMLQVCVGVCIVEFKFLNLGLFKSKDLWDSEVGMLLLCSHAGHPVVFTAYSNRKSLRKIEAICKSPLSSDLWKFSCRKGEHLIWVMLKY